MVWSFAAEMREAGPSCRRVVFDAVSVRGRVKVVVAVFEVRMRLGMLSFGAREYRGVGRVLVAAAFII